MYNRHTKDSFEQIFLSLAGLAVVFWEARASFHLSHFRNAHPETEAWVFPAQVKSA